MRRPVTLLTLALVTGCSIVEDPEPSTFEIRFSAPSIATDAALDVRATVEVGGELRTLTRTDFVPVGDGQLDALGLYIPETGAGEVTCAVGRADVTSEGTVALEVEDGYLYRVSCSVQTGPVGCFGCRGAEDFALDPALGFDADARLYVSWGGDPADDLPDY